ncbi:MAG: hypothetical protein ACRDVG_01065 [Jatrophihabitantaceae bacterium]
MSPSESQLRAALQDGEGDRPDADALISHAVGVRRERRRRITAVAGGATIVAVVGLGITALVRMPGSTGGGSSADSAAGGSAHSQPKIATGGLRAQTAASAPASGSTLYASNPVACPAAPDRFLLPGGGGSAQFGSTDPLFPNGARSIRACAYPLPVAARTRTTVLEGAEASAVAVTIDSSRSTTGKASCAHGANYLGGTIELFPVDAQGHRVAPVVITLGCNASVATNGTGVRYVADLPQKLIDIVRPIAVRSLPVQGPGGLNSGSPPH